jgi:hypothetical protein
MKRFSENINENQKHYSNDLKLYNEIYDLINENLRPKMDGKDSDKINIVGKEDLVKELSKIVDNQVIKEKINFFKKIEKNPKLILEAKTSKDFAEELKEDFKKVAQTIYSCKTDDQCDTAKKMVDNLKNKYHKKLDQMGLFRLDRFYDKYGDYNKRIEELNNAIKDKRIEIKYETYKKSKERDGKSFLDIEKWKKENNMNEAWGSPYKLDENFNSENQKADINIITDYVKKLSSKIKIRLFKNGNDSESIDNTKMTIKFNDLILDIDIKPTNIKVMKNNEKFNLTNIKELKDFIKNEIEKENKLDESVDNKNIKAEIMDIIKKNIKLKDDDILFLPEIRKYNQHSSNILVWIDEVRKEKEIMDDWYYRHTNY